MKTPPSVARLDRLVAQALVRAEYSGRGLTLVVAVSGGPDSSALLYSLHRLSNEHRFKLHVAHLNHDLRGEESDQDAHFVENIAADLGLPATLAKEDPLVYQRSKRISSFEQVTREMRYSFLRRVALEQEAIAVAVGHTSDDQAETVLEHILRGSGIHGLRGMTEVAPWPWPLNADGVAVFRPLLAAVKSETVGYCQALGREYRQDSDNYLPQFTRNRVRHDLIPLLAADYNPRIADSLVRLSRTAGLELDYLEQECDRWWPLVASELGEPQGEIRFDRAELIGRHPALQRMLLRRGFVTMAGDARRLQESHLANMSEVLQRGRSGSSLSLPRGIWLHVTPDSLVLSRHPHLVCPLPPLEGEHKLEIPNAEGKTLVTRVSDWKISAQILPPGCPPLDSPQDNFTARLSLDSVGESIWIRSRQEGDRFQPLGMSAAKKLQDFFTDLKVPRDWRDHVPLVVCPRGVAWVVGHRIAEWAKVIVDQPGESPVLQITFSR